MTTPLPTNLTIIIAKMKTNRIMWSNWREWEAWYLEQKSLAVWFWSSQSSFFRRVEARGAGVDLVAMQLLWPG